MKINNLEDRFIYEEEVKELKPKKMVVETPKLINGDRTTPLYSTTSFADIINSVDRVIGIRVSYIPETKSFIYADIRQWIHPMMLRQAILQGLFPNIQNYADLKNSKKVYDFGVTNKEEGVQAFEDDSYNIRRDYSKFIIMTRPDQPIFEETDIQDILAKFN